MSIRLERCGGPLLLLAAVDAAAVWQCTDYI